MRTQTTELRLQHEWPASQSVDLAQTLGVSAPTYASSGSASSVQKVGWVCSSLGRWVVLLTVATAPITFADVSQELRRSGSSSLAWSGWRRRGQVITLREARLLAMQILVRTESRLHEDRAAEGRLLQYAFDEDTTSA
jgi:hypothetical protein